MKFYRCNHCKQIITKLNDSGVPVICCGEPMKELVPNTTDAAGEKHVPVVEVNGKDVKVTVGSVIHPMVEEHFIEWVVVETTKGVLRRNLKAGEAPKVEFALLPDEEVQAVYAYCNLHGLWRA